MNDKLERFNELVNSNDHFVYHSKELIVYRVKFARTLGRMIEGSLYHPEKPYLLFIAYKVTHRVKRMAGRCFIWNETEETCNGINVDSKEQGFGEPRFDGMEAAVFVTDGCVIVFGNVRIETSYIGRGGKRVRCKVYLRGRLATHFTLGREVFDRVVALGWGYK